MGAEAEVGALAWVVENFFTRAGERHHEIDFCFRATLRAEPPLLKSDGPFGGVDAAVPLVFEWRAVADLGGLNLLPSFLRGALPGVPSTTPRVVRDDEAGG